MALRSVQSLRLVTLRILQINDALVLFIRMLLGSIVFNPSPLRPIFRRLLQPACEILITALFFVGVWKIVRKLLNGRSGGISDRFIVMQYEEHRHRAQFNFSACSAATFDNGIDMGTFRARAVVSDQTRP